MGLWWYVYDEYFSFRTISIELKKAKEPIGKDNNKWILTISKKVDLCIAAWGNDGLYLIRSDKIKELVPNLHCLKINSGGEPAHPLYLKADLSQLDLFKILKLYIYIRKLQHEKIIYTFLFNILF